MNVIEERLAESRSMMLQIVNLFQSIVWIGGCESIDKSARIKFGNAQKLANEIYLEFNGKVNYLCQTHADTKAEGDVGKQRK